MSTGRIIPTVGFLLSCLLLAGCAASSGWTERDTDNEAKTVIPLSQEAVDEALRAPELTQAAIARAAHQPQAMARDLRAAAEQGNPIAQQQLGQLYRTGDGLARDDAAAFHWTKLAAEQGLGEAEVILAEHYFTGRGTPVQAAEGMRWLQLAKAQERPVIWVMAGQLHLTGAQPLAETVHSGTEAGKEATGLTPDPVEAVRLFRKAAETGSDAGEYAMCLAQMKGVGGLTASRADAQVWCDRAAARGNLDARQYSTAKPQLPGSDDDPARREWAAHLLYDIGFGMVYLVAAFVSSGGIGLLN
jgi:TPR repeat protein